MKHWQWNTGNKDFDKENFLLNNRILISQKNVTVGFFNQLPGGSVGTSLFQITRTNRWLEIYEFKKFQPDFIVNHDSWFIVIYRDSLFDLWWEQRFGLKDCLFQFSRFHVLAKNFDSNLESSAIEKSGGESSLMSKNFAEGNQGGESKLESPRFPATIRTSSPKSHSSRTSGPLPAKLHM